MDTMMLMTEPCIPGALLDISPVTGIPWVAFDPTVLEGRTERRDGFVTVTESMVDGLDPSMTLIADVFGGEVRVGDRETDLIIGWVRFDSIPSDWETAARASGRIGVIVGDVERIVAAVSSGDDALRDDADRMAIIPLMR